MLCVVCMETSLRTDLWMVGGCWGMSFLWVGKGGG